MNFLLKGFVSFIMLLFTVAAYAGTKYQKFAK
jgi:hypothetical protein